MFNPKIKSFTLKVTKTHSLIRNNLHTRTGLTLRQNKHVLRTLRDNGTPKKIQPQCNLFHHPDIRLKNTPKIIKKKCRKMACT